MLGWQPCDSSDRSYLGYEGECDGRALGVRVRREGGRRVLQEGQPEQSYEKRRRPPGTVERLRTLRPVLRRDEPRAGDRIDAEDAAPRQILVAHPRGT